MNLKLLPTIVAAVIILTRSGQAQTPPAGSDVESIRKEMQQLRDDYERRIQSLEERLRHVEAGTNVTKSIAVEAVSTNSAPTISERGNAFADLQFNHTTETRDWAIAQERSPIFKERAEHVLNDFVEIGGYFRAGYGRDDEGGPQPGFQAPGAFAKYRLGNEAENYGELIFAKNWYTPDLFAFDAKERPDGTPTGPIARTQVRVAFLDPYSNSGGDFQTSLPEAWAEIGNVIDSQPSLKFWAGNRYYRRQDIHINDFFFYNMSGAGGGIEDWELPFGKLALAWIGDGSQSGVYASDIAIQPDPENQAGFSRQNIDLSLYDVPLPWGKGEFAVVFANEDSGKDATGQQASDSQGVAFLFLHTREKFIDEQGINKFSLQFGTAAAKTFTSGYETFANTNGTYIVPDESGSWRFRVTESFVTQPWQHLSISPAVVYQYTDYDNSQGNVQWLSAGVRPVYHFNRFFSLAFESGADYVDDSGADRAGTLYKLTLAPQVSLGDHFLSRPVIRAYVTYATWANDFKGLIGGNDYLNQTSGWTWGMQMETWW